MPPRDEIDFRTRNFSQRARDTARSAAWLLARMEKVPLLESKRGRFQFVLLRRGPTKT